MDKQTSNNMPWAENVIIADMDYVDNVAFDLTVNFERMLGRRIPKADLARWADCIALDGGLREGDHEVQVVLLHGKQAMALDNFQPAHYANELEGKAFRDSLGEFTLCPVCFEDVVSRDDLLLDIVETVAHKDDVKRLMVIPNAESDGLWEALRRTLQRVPEEKRVTLFAMQPMAGGNFRQEILGYSLMQALGIRGEELK